MTQLAVPCAQVGLCRIGNRGDICDARERIIVTITQSTEFGSEQLIVHVVGIGVDQIVLPNIDIGRIDSPDEHAGAGKVLVPLDALAVLDDEVLILVRGVHAVTRIALLKGRHRNSALTIYEDGLGKAEGIAFKQAVTRRIAAIVVLEAASHDRPGHGMLGVNTSTAVGIGIIKVRQTQTMAELVTDSANTGNIVIIDIVLIFFSCHVGRAGIEFEVHTI